MQIPPASKRGKPRFIRKVCQLSLGKPHCTSAMAGPKGRESSTSAAPREQALGPRSLLDPERQAAVGDIQLALPAWGRWWLGSSSLRGQAQAIKQALELFQKGKVEVTYGSAHFF